MVGEKRLWQHCDRILTDGSNERLNYLHDADERKRDIKHILSSESIGSQDHGKKAVLIYSQQNYQ
jgi:hypothetical protein